MSETTIELKKAKLLDKKYLHVEYTEYSPSKEDPNDLIDTYITKKCGHLAHEDLINAYDKLIPHLCFLTEFLDENYAEDRTWAPNEEMSVFDLPAFEKFQVTSFSIGGDGEFEGITITGRRNLANGRVLNLNTPFTAFNDENNPYTFANEMWIAYTDLCHEVEEYIGGKYAPSKQMDIDFEEMPKEDKGLKVTVQDKSGNWIEVPALTKAMNN